LPSSGRRVAEGQKLVKEIISAGGSALFVRTDVARQDDIVALVEKTCDSIWTKSKGFESLHGQRDILTELLRREREEASQASSPEERESTHDYRESFELEKVLLPLFRAKHIITVENELQRDLI